MGVHGRTFVGKTSTRSTSSSAKNKKPTEEINTQLKSISPKSSSSLTAAGTQASNAPESVVDANNMAPALTEPLSPTDKLSPATADVSPVAITTGTKKETGEVQLEPSATSSSASSTSTSGNNNQREKRSTSRNIPATTRVTRSKDSPSIPERVNTPSTAIRKSPIANNTRKLKLDATATTATEIGIPTTASESNVNEPMGLSTVTPSTTTITTSDPNKTPTSNNNNTIACKESTTEKLLADLTTDFEETITAEICLRKLEVKVSTPDAAQLSASETEGEVTAPTVKDDSAEAISSASKKTVYMEVAGDDAKIEDNKEIAAASPQTATAVNNEPMAAAIPLAVIPEISISEGSVESSTAVARLLGVEDLPPINSDSTMTASEEETEELDALEARLSQLDGTAVTPITCDETSNITIAPSTFVTATSSSSNAIVTTSTPPRTPSQLLLTPTIGGGGVSAAPPTAVQQLLLTPTSSSSQTLALTPQSTSSLMREVGAATVTGGEIEDQEFEEVLKALKGFDANSASADTVLDLNVLFNEVYTTLNCEEIGNNNQQQQNLCNSTSTSNANSKVTLSPLKELHGEIERKQQCMQRKIEFIIRRLRKMQVRYMSKHTTEEIAGLFELAARLTNKGSSQAQTGTDLVAKSVISARPPAISWEEDIKHPIPASQVTNLLQRIETSANAQQLCTTPSKSVNLPTYSAPTLSSTQQLKKSKKFGDSASTPVATTPVDAQKSGDEVISTLNTHVVDELTHVAGMLKAEMRDVQTAYDSDATESSSGGESADEMVAYNNQVQQSLSIVKRAAWRYSRERAAIASRWSWLLSQIADLEIKIRQHTELYQEVVRTKGAVVCEEELARSEKITAAPREIVTAYAEMDEAALSGASRTRGFLSTQFRKRKLLQTTSLHTISKKAARPSTIKCGCQWPLNPCALCTGRTDPTAPRDLPDTMMLPERVALLDPGFHPVLSFPEDVNNSIHIEAIARTSNWQQRIVRIQPKSVARSIWKAEREAANSSGHNVSRKFGDVLLPTQKRRYIRRKERNVTSSATAAGRPTVAASATSSGGGVGVSSNNNSLDGLANPKSATPQSTGAIHTLNVKLDPQTMGNGTANLFTSTTSTTPLRANKATALKQVAQNSKKMHSHLVGDGILLEPPSPNNNNIINSNQMNCQTPQNYDPYNPNQVHSSLISNHHQQQHNNINNNNKKGKQRKAMTMASFHNQNSNSNHSFQHNYNNNNSTQIQQNYLNGDITSDYWDSLGSRSRTASPTHGVGGGSNYHKYERSVERRNRISYDIDNIVIPYSVAATTRVEILPYKEIPTPKWRVFDEEMEEMIVEEPSGRNSNDSMQLTKKSNEDLSMREISLLKSDTKVEQDCSSTQSISNQSVTKCGTATKTVEENENSTENTPKNESISKGLKSECFKANDLVTKDTSSLQNDDSEPPTKRIKVNKHSNCSETHTKEEEIEFENDNQDKEQIILADLEEDISEESFNSRHERALNEERRKFQTYLKFPWSTRSRANRRIDSRAESSGANTPDPASPAPNTPSLGGGDQESIPSPLAPSTPLTPLETINEAPESGLINNISTQHSSITIAPPAFPITAGSFSSKRNERRRTTSVKNQHTERSERRSLTPDSREVPFIVPPYEPMKFPLNDETFEMISSVTLLPPSVSNFYVDDYVSKDDHHSNMAIVAGGAGAGGVMASGSSYFKSAANARSFRRNSSIRNEFIQQRSLSSKTSNCDVNGKRRKTNKRHRRNIDMTHQVAESSDATKFLPYINGQSRVGVSTSAINSATTTYSTDIEDDVEDIDDADYYNEMMLEDDDDDDGYSKHPLAPGIDIDNFIGDDGGYNAYVGGGNSNSLLGVSDTESEVDPFEDDDPNDPEWKGESRSERPERFRKRS